MASGEDMAKRWMAHRRVTLDLLDRIPDDRASFKPWPDAMTCAQLAAHIGGSHHMFATLAAGLPFERPDPATLPADLPGVRDLLRRLTEEDEATLNGLTADDMRREVTMRAGAMPANDALAMAREHEVHHKGQLFEYARICGVESVPGWIRP